MLLTMVDPIKTADTMANKCLMKTDSMANIARSRIAHPAIFKPMIFIPLLIVSVPSISFEAEALKRLPQRDRRRQIKLLVCSYPESPHVLGEGWGLVGCSKAP